MAGGVGTDGLDPFGYANATMIVVGRGVFPAGSSSWRATAGSRRNWRRAGRRKAAPPNRVLNLRKGVKFLERPGNSRPTTRSIR